MRFLITGTPRSGTRFGAILFNELGCECRHESPSLRPTTTIAQAAHYLSHGTHGESCWMGWLPARMTRGFGLPILHFVRDPWRVVDSLAHRTSILSDRAPIGDCGFDSFRALVESVCPGIFEMENKLDRCARFVVEWNEAISAVGAKVLTSKVESIDANRVLWMLNFVGDARVPDRAHIESAIERTRQDPNSGLTTSEVTMTPEQLAAAMSTEALAMLNGYAAMHRYETVDVGLSVV